MGPPPPASSHWHAVCATVAGNLGTCWYRSPQLTPQAPLQPPTNIWTAVDLAGLLTMLDLAGPDVKKGLVCPMLT